MTPSELRTLFSQIVGDFPEFRSLVVRTQEAASQPQVKLQLSQLIAVMDENFGKAKIQVPAALDQLDQDFANIETTAAQLKQAQAQAQADLVAAMAAAKQGPKRKVPKIDPQLGPDLAQELVDRFGPTKDASINVCECGDFWAHWQDEHGIHHPHDEEN